MGYWWSGGGGWVDCNGEVMGKARKKNVLGMSTLVGGLLEDQAVKRGSKFVKEGLKKNINESGVYSVLLQTQILNSKGKHIGDKAVGVISKTFNSSSEINEYMDTYYPNDFYAHDFTESNRVKEWKKKFGVIRAKNPDNELTLEEKEQRRLAKELTRKMIEDAKKKHGKLGGKGDYDPRKFKRNPAPEAEDLSEKWHGRAPKQTSEVVEIETYEEDLAELADLEELGILTQDLSQYFISFKKDRPKLCAEDEDNLIFVGGDQKICTDDVGVVQDGKRLVPLGWCYQIVYETDKHHLEGSNGVSESYEHFFAEEWYKENFDSVDEFKTSDAWFAAMLKDGLVEEAIENGLIPMLVYNKTDQKLILVGGSYTIEDVGIKN